MPGTRVLIVDDAVVIRRLLSDILAEDPDIEVVGTASNGKIALAKVEQVNPDIITLDVEMPELDGVATLKALRAAGHRQPVIMFSTLTEKAAVTTLDALAAGASDYVTKPANVGSVMEAKQRVRDQLVPKIKALAPAGHAPPPRAHTSPFPASRASGPPRTPATARAPGGAPARGARREGRVDCVAIGVSTGGPNALTALFQHLPGDFPAPIVIVQHMPPVFTRQLAARLSSVSALDVDEGERGMVLRPGHAVLAPGDFHMEVVRVGTQMQIKLQQGPPENSCRPSADVLFRSVAAAYGGHSLGVIMTGMGQDGLHGARHIHECGGGIVAQDRETSVVWGMPGAVADAGLADRVLPLSMLSDELVRRARTQRSAPIGRGAPVR